MQQSHTHTHTHTPAGIPKLDDANDAGGRNSEHCTLILTEGDSAKALAVSGLSVVGRDKYGVFPLRGKLLNVRDASASQVSGNAEIQHIKQILGLQHGKVCGGVGGGGVCGWVEVLVVCMLLCACCCVHVCICDCHAYG